MSAEDMSDTAWPLHDVIAKLADAADHLLNDHACDTHGHEEIGVARDAARRWLTAREARIAAAKEKVERAKLAMVAFFACTTCGDTHRMSLRGELVPCTRCPVPCAKCRSGAGVPGQPLGAYCASTPCACACHPVNTAQAAALAALAAEAS